jgi:hypothetical protein
VNSQVHTTAIETPDLATAGVPVYANVVHTSFTPYDFRITFSLLTVPHDQPGGAGTEPEVVSLTPQAVAQVVLPAGALASVVDLLRAQLDQFIDQFGAPQPSVAQPTSPP